MKGIRKILDNFDLNSLKKYIFFSVLFIVTLVLVGTINITQARYENNTDISIEPTLAFFIVDVSSQTGQIKLDGMTPRTEPYLYTFNVSNFRGTRKANVDLTYSIELITTTNMPLNYRIYKGNSSSQNEVDSDTVVQDDNDVYFRHLLINDVNTMPYSDYVTDIYVLSVEFPLVYKDNADDYAGIIDLVDIKINAEQVV